MLRKIGLYTSWWRLSSLSKKTKFKIKAKRTEILRVDNLCIFDELIIDISLLSVWILHGSKRTFELTACKQVMKKECFFLRWFKFSLKAWWMSIDSDRISVHRYDWLPSPLSTFGGKTLPAAYFADSCAETSSVNLTGKIALTTNGTCSYAKQVFSYGSYIKAFYVWKFDFKLFSCFISP